jgi:membrane-anchored mycosin MYCP
MTTVDHCSVAHNPVASWPPAGAQKPRLDGSFRPCRAIGGNTLAMPIDPADAFPTNEQVMDETFVVGVVDTGLVGGPDAIHPWLRGHVLPPIDNDPLQDSGLPIRPDDGHGTFIAGLILREAPRAALRVVRGLDADADSAKSSDEKDEKVAAAIRGLFNAHAPSAADAKIINLSFYGELSEFVAPPRIKSAIEDASRQGIVVIVAAGNDPRRMIWPAALGQDPDITNLHVVGAVDETVSRNELQTPVVAAFSNRETWVRVYANGVHVRGPFYAGDFTYDRHEHRVHSYVLGTMQQVTPVHHTGWARWSGTSFAAATVSGIIAREAMADRSTSIAEKARELLAPNTTITGAEAADQYVCWLRGVDSDWPR